MAKTAKPQGNVATQFKKGVSGNPNGRPKGAKEGVRACLRRMLRLIPNEKWQEVLRESGVQDAEGTVAEIVAAALSGKAIGGDVGAIRLMLDHTEKPLVQEKDENEGAVFFVMPEKSRRKVGKKPDAERS